MSTIYIQEVGMFVQLCWSTIFSFSKELFIKYVGNGGGGGAGGTEDFLGVMKYFRHILMGHEIFFKMNTKIEEI